MSNQKGAICVKDPQEILKKNPGSIIFARYAEELAHEGRNDEALRVLEKGINSNPNYAPGHSVLAEILFTMDSYEKAALELKASLHLDPQMPKDHFKLGNYYLEQNRPDKAIQYLWSALRFEPHVHDIQSAFDKAQLSITPPVDSTLSGDTEKELSQLTEEIEGTESLDIPELDFGKEGFYKEEGDVIDEIPDVDKSEVSLSYEELEAATSFSTESVDKSEEVVKETVEEKDVFFTKGEGTQTVEEDISEGLSEYSAILEKERTSELETVRDDTQRAYEKNILEINEEEEYDLSRYESDLSTGVDEEPLLSEEERAELLTYNESTEEIDSQAMEDMQPFEDETGDEKDEGLGGVESEELISERSPEEQIVLSGKGFEEGEGKRDHKQETEEIDYSDIFLCNGFAQEVEDVSESRLEQPEQIVKHEDKITLTESIAAEEVSHTEPEVESLTTEIVKGKEESTGLTDTIESDEILGLKMKTLKIPSDSLKIIEDLIKNVPHGEFSAKGKKDEEVHTPSLQELIVDYENFFEEESEESSTRRDERAGSMSENLSEISRVGEDATATLAEIYFSQGIFSRALDIYSSLLKKQPDNKELKSRIEEIKKIREQQSDIL